MHDWSVVLRPQSKKEHGGYLEIISGEEQDAIDLLELYARLIQGHGFVPKAGEWLNRSPAHVMRRLGRRTFRVRVECWQREYEGTDGESLGSGYLTIVDHGPTPGEEQ